MSDSRATPPAAVAIIGMAGRFPDAPDLATFWRNLAGGVESLMTLTDAELAAAGVPAAQIADPSYVKKCTCLEGADQFDAAFFGFSAREAEILDPQQRVFLECAWEAFEDAGYGAGRGLGAVGVFAGASLNTYLLSNLLANPAAIATAGAYQTMIASDKDFLATRVSYKLDLRGPGLTVQTACSTSLVAVQLACQSLLDGQCDLALAGGVSIGFPERVGYLYREGMILSPDGHCRPFDARGQGIRPGAGAGAVVLKRLSDAVADGDSIRAVILGAAINNDGAAKMGYTAPSLDGQAEVIRLAQARAGVSPETISYVEAHGTATPLGDPIEVGALTQVFGAARNGGAGCALGSVKSNIGHLDAAAGVAGLIKTVLSLEHRMLPPSLNFETPNPEIDFDRSPFYVNHTLVEWASTGRRRAGVSSFGIGGTNAHVVLEEAPPREASVVRQPAQLVVLSARSASALERASGNVADRLAGGSSLCLADVAYTLQVGRKRFEHRRAVVGRTAEEIVEALRRPERSTPALSAGSPAVAFMFSGQGSQHSGMGRRLYQAEPTFREELDRVTEMLAPHLDRDLKALMVDEPSAEVDSVLQQTRYAQPALFAFEYALAQTWIRWGIRPAAMIGHSIGEYVAACLSGVLSLEDALRLVAERGRLMQAMPAGRMVAVPLSEAELAPLLNGAVSLAAINGPSLSVVGGPEAAVAEFERLIGRQGIECRPLHTSHAFHSAMMDPVLPPFRRVLDEVAFGQPTLPYISNLTGTWVGAEAGQPDYWSRHLRQPVRFAAGVAELLRTPDLVLLEVGPGKTLATLARQAAGAAGRPIWHSLPHPLEGRDEFETMLRTLGDLWVAGVEPAWDVVHRGERLHRVALPTYPFERQSYRIEPAREVGVAAMPAAPARKTDLADWFSVPSWKRVPGPREAGRTLSADDRAPWLIFLDPSGVGTRIANQLRAAGRMCATATIGTSYDARGADYTIRLGHWEDYAALLSDLKARGAAPERVIHLWSVSGQGEDEELEQVQARGFSSVIDLMHSLAEQELDRGLALTVVSTGVHRVLGTEPLVPARALVLGPCRAIPPEFPGVRCRAVDIDVAADREEIARTLIADTALDPASEVAAYRGGRRWVQVFEPMPLGAVAGSPPRLRSGGVYLITGGLGELGRVVARFLAETVAAKLVLTGRMSLPPPAAWSEWLATHPGDDPVAQRIRAVQELESLGAQVLTVDADVSVRADMERVAQLTRERFGPVNGIFHLAGLPGGQLIHRHSGPAADAVLAPKVQGTLLLEPLFEGPALDLIVLYSSVSTVAGFLGAADYSAANSFLDGYAAARSRPDRPVIAINWDVWHDIGMAARGIEAAGSARDAAREYLDRFGIRNEEGLEALRRALGASVPQLVVATRALAMLGTEGTVPLPSAAAATVVLARHTRPELAQQFVEPEDAIESLVAGLWQELLGLDRVGVEDNFFDLGGHSLLATGLLSRIQESCGVKLPLRTIFEAPTIRALAARIQAVRWAAEPASDTVDADREQFEI
jgi:acyl transferase domain-containing protein